MRGNVITPPPSYELQLNDVCRRRVAAAEALGGARRPAQSQRAAPHNMVLEREPVALTATRIDSRDSKGGFYEDSEVEEEGVCAVCPGGARCAGRSRDAPVVHAPPAALLTPHAATRLCVTTIY
ncbi:PREDICTED: uncharacterized protein LOC106108183 [Papilio polytes]|uniref:uncharacterized protein LOC106108183 n=1 Tax=Papilio polytes TaxID=76194 RepID=UPI00067641E7|nr:PREDICTED: uncharacterized protein LOC106108183 [Papilio polytes]